MPHIYREIIPYNFIISTFRTLSSTISESTTFCLEDAYTDLNLKKNHTHSNLASLTRIQTPENVPLQLKQFLLLLLVQFQTGPHLFTLLHCHHRV